MCVCIIHIRKKSLMMFFILFFFYLFSSNFRLLVTFSQGTLASLYSTNQDLMSQLQTKKHKVIDTPKHSVSLLNINFKSYR